MAKKKKSIEKQVEGLTKNSFDLIQSIEFLIKEGTDEYTGIKVTKKDGAEFTHGPDVISMENAEMLINDFEDYQKRITFKEGCTYQLQNKSNGDVFKVEVDNVGEDWVFLINENDTESWQIHYDELFSTYNVKELNIEFPEPEPEKVTHAKNMEYTHKLTADELVKIADEQNLLLEENISLAFELDIVKKRINPRIDSNEKRIAELHRQYSTKILTRTETITPVLDWDKGTMSYLHPETKEVLEEIAIPQEVRQQTLDLGPAAETDSEREQWFDYFLNFDGVERPKGVTDKRIEKIKAEVLFSDYFEKLCTECSNANKDEETQKKFVTQFWAYLHDLMVSKRMLKS